MLAAATYLAGALEPWVALIVFLTIGSYIPLTIIVTEWRGNFRRDMNRTENARSARVTDALLNWETVKYFTNENLEQDKYGEAIDQYQVCGGLVSRFCLVSSVRECQTAAACGKGL